MRLSRELSPGEGSRREKMVTIFTLFCILIIDSENKHNLLNKITWKPKKKKKKRWTLLAPPLPLRVWDRHSKEDV